MNEPHTDPVAHNRRAWDREVEKGNEWSRPVTPEVVAKARAEWTAIGGNRPDSWRPKDQSRWTIISIRRRRGRTRRLPS